MDKNTINGTADRAAVELEHIRQMVNESTAMVQKLMAESRKLDTENRKLGAEHRWYPAIIASTATLAIVAIAKLFL
jgi:hypothetical protein